MNNLKRICNSVTFSIPAGWPNPNDTYPSSGQTQLSRPSETWTKLSSHVVLCRIDLEKLPPLSHQVMNGEGLVSKSRLWQLSNVRGPACIPCMYVYVHVSVCVGIILCVFVCVFTYNSTSIDICILILILVYKEFAYIHTETTVVSFWENSDSSNTGKFQSLEGKKGNYKPYTLNTYLVSFVGVFCFVLCLFVF